MRVGLPAISLFESMMREQAIMLHIGDQVLRALGSLLIDTSASVLALLSPLRRQLDAASRSIGKKAAYDLRIHAWRPRIVEVTEDGHFRFITCDLWSATHADESIPNVGALQFSQNTVSN